MIDELWRKFRNGTEKKAQFLMANVQMLSRYAIEIYRLTTAKK